MSARVSEAVAIRDDEAGLELRVSAAAPSKEGGVRFEVHVLATRARTAGSTLEPGDVVTLELSPEVAGELRAGITRALKTSAVES